MFMKNWFKKLIASIQSMKNSRQLKGLKKFLKTSKFSSWDDQSVARGVAAGLAGAVIPGFQIFYTAILVIILRGNLPIALVFTLVTNPLTSAPITYGIYFIGKLIIGNSGVNLDIQNLHWDFYSFHTAWSNLSTWLLQFGEAFFIGLPIVSICLGLLGYFGTILFFKISVLLFHRKKK